MSTESHPVNPDVKPLSKAETAAAIVEGSKPTPPTS